MGERAGMTSDEAVAIIEQGVPEHAHNIDRNTLSRGGLADFLYMLSQDHRANYLGDLDVVCDDTARKDGKELLGQIVGT